MISRILNAAAALAVALAAAAAAAQPAPHFGAPPAEVRDVPVQLHGRSVSDPYRWLEEVERPEVQAWLRAQGEVARSVLDRIDGRERILARIVELSKAQGDAVSRVTSMPGGRLYYLKREVGARQFRLMLREGGRERVLVDPEVESGRTGVPHAINFYRPSWDGRHVAYGISAGGSENASLHVIEAASGRRVAGPIPRVTETTMHWLPDSRSLTFTQLRELPPGAPAAEAYLDSRVAWLRLAAPSRPRSVFGPRVTPGLGLERLDVGEIVTVPGSRWMVARTTDTTLPEGKLFVAPRAALGRRDVPWRPIADASALVVEIALRGDHLYVLHRRGAPRRELVRVDLARGDDLGRAEPVARAPADGVIEDFVLTPRGIVTEVRQGASVGLRRHAQGDLDGRPVAAPGAGAAFLARSPGGGDERIVYAFARWTEPTRWWRLDGDASSLLELGRAAIPPGLPAISVRDVVFPSHDGVAVPMTVLHRADLALDGSAPVRLEGYGAYGASTSAFYSAAQVAWIEAGGVVAHVNPRGSGVGGETSYRAGFKTSKPNTWKDGIAAARWLIEQRYGSPRTMAILGTSAGGIFVGRAVTEAPELFAAAVFDVGVLDALRSEASANGATNTSEFGTVEDPVEARALLEMSTYHAIRDGVAYPGVLLVHGLNDPRVDVWHSAKTTARLQAANPRGRPALLRLDAQAGHGVGSTLTQRLQLAADQQAFLLWQMGKLGLRD